MPQYYYQPYFGFLQCWQFIARSLKVSALWCLIFVVSGFVQLAPQARADLPLDAIVIEPETMTIKGSGWVVQENFEGWFKGWTTGNRCLYGAKPGEGEATIEFNCPAAGNYRIWVRYLDLAAKSRGTSLNSFIVEAKQHKTAFDSADDDLDFSDLDKKADGMGLDLLPTNVSVDKKNSKEFDKFSLRMGEANQIKWGDSWAAFVWDSMDARLGKGPCTLRVTKTHARRTERHQRLLDCIIITTNQAYEAQTEDLTPVYVRFDVPAARTNALRFFLRSRRSDGSDFFEHVSWGTPFVKPVKPGASSEWIELSRYLKAGKLGQYNRVTFGCCIKDRGDLRDAEYTVNLSLTPSPEGIVKTVERTGLGRSVSFRIDLNNREEIRSELEESAANLMRSQAVPAIGCYPTQFVFNTSCEIGSCMDQTIKNELQALRNIGINRIAFSPGVAERYVSEGFSRCRVGFYTWNLAERPTNSPSGVCFLNPNIEAIQREVERAEAIAKQYPPSIEVVRLGSLADEPGFNYLAHMPMCPVCQKAFPEYLKAQQVPYSVFAKELDDIAMASVLTDDAQKTDVTGTLDDVMPCSDTNYPHLFYWSSRFGINTVTEFIRTCTQAAEKQNPEWLTTLNFANQLRSTLAGSGLDWFEIFRSKAMTYGENEDYVAWVKNFQIRGYLMAVMRAACQTHGYHYGPLAAYPSNTGWDVVAGGFSQIGQGATYISFFNYGPHYISASSPCSGLQWVHDSTRHLTYATGAVEKYLFGAKVMRCDVATLLSTTSDIWNFDQSADGQTFANLYGMERIYLYLILRHLQASVDVLAEEDLTEELKKYPMLLVSDSHLRRAFAQPVRDWVEAGGTLYVGANALAYDEYNQPLGLLEGMGLQRSALEIDENLMPGRPEYELRHRKSLGLVQTKDPFNAIFATQKLSGGETLFKLGDEEAAMVEVGFGKGRIIAACTFPAMEYIKTSDWNKDLPTLSTVHFKSGPRDFIAKALERGRVVPRAYCNNMFLEANLLEKGNVVIVALANWSGQEQEATLRFQGLGRIKDVKAVRTPIKIVSQTNEELVVAGCFGAGDYLTLER